MSDSLQGGSIQTFDDVLIKYGEFGNYQKFIYILYSCPYIFTSMQLMGWTFVGVELPHRCLEPHENISTVLYNSSGLEEVSSCFINGNETCSEYVYDTQMIGDSVVKEWDLVCEDKEKIARIGSSPMIGYLLGGIIFGTLSDKIGRKFTFLLSVTLLFISSGACAFAHSAFVFMILRFIVGIAIPGIETSCFVMGLELVGPSKRTLAGLLCWFFESMGLLTTVFISYNIHDNWRLLQGIFASPLILFLLYYFFTPESPRWLVSRGRTKEAEKTIHKILKSNGFDKPEENLIELLEKNNMGESQKIRHYTFLDLYKTPNLRIKTLILNWLWIVLASFYYIMLLDQSDLSSNPYLGFFITVAAQLPCYVYVMFTIDHPAVGRKKSLVILLAIAGTCLITHPFVSSKGNTYWISFSLSLIGRLSATSSFTILCLFSSEQFPTVLRGIGFSFNLTVSRIGSILAPYALMMGKYSHVIFGVGALISAILVSYLTETHGIQLPDSIKDSEKIQPAFPWQQGKKSTKSTGDV